MEEEASEDMLKMAGTVNDVIHEQSTIKVVKLRLPWLFTGLIGGLFAAIVMSRFEHSFKTIIALTFFIPVITALAGNVGMQSSAIIVRGLATGEIDISQTGFKIFQEIKASLINGLILGLVISCLEFLWMGDIRLGVIIGIATLSVNILASIIGTAVPLLLKRFSIDPALATGPFVTTTNDILGLLVYLSLASLGIKYL